MFTYWAIPGFPYVFFHHDLTPAAPVRVKIHQYRFGIFFYFFRMLQNTTSILPNCLLRPEPEQKWQRNKYTTGKKKWRDFFIRFFNWRIDDSHQNIRKKPDSMIAETGILKKDYKKDNPSIEILMKFKWVVLRTFSNWNNQDEINYWK